MQITSEGDAGDIAYMSCIIKAMPDGPHELLIEEKKDGGIAKTRPTAEGLVAFVGPFLESQSYITKVRLIEPTDAPVWRSGGFRPEGFVRHTETLLSAHLNHYNSHRPGILPVDTSKPWFDTSPDPKGFGRVIVNRTYRYNNKDFPWKGIVDFYGEQIAFIGLPFEHKSFCELYGQVNYLPTHSLLEVAQLIKASNLFIGNQSCAFAVAEGLKHPSIQETSLRIPDCIFKRDNVQHVWNGNVILPSFDGGEPLELRAPGMDPNTISLMVTPPGGWHYHRIIAETYPQAEELVRQLPEFRGKSLDDVKYAIRKFNLDRLPNHFRPQHEGGKVLMALANAGY